MAGKSDTFENDLLKLIFQNIAITTIGDAGGLLPSAAPGSLHVSLMTADPLDVGTQTTSEANYTPYVRVAVARSAAGWGITGSVVSPIANIDFALCTAGTSNVTFFGVGAAASAAGKLMYFGAVSPPLSVSNGVIPRLTTATQITED